MELTQQDFEERLGRVADGTADDEDRRLVKHYRAEGFVASDEPVDGSWLAGDQEASGDDYEALGYRDLQKLAREYGLNAGGSEADLVARLREFDAQKNAEQGGA